MRGLERIDDGPLHELTVAVVMTVNGREQVETVCSPNTYRTCSRVQYIAPTMPNEMVSGDSISLSLRATDKLGQQSTSEELTVALTQQPNAIVRGVQEGTNLSAINVGDVAEFSFRVKDMANRSVPLQSVRLALYGSDSEAPILTRQSATDGQGHAYFSVPTNSLTTGRYRVVASLSNYPSISPVSLYFDVLPGQPKALHIAHIDDVEANEVFALTMRMVDSAGNTTTQIADAEVQLAFNNPDFHFAFASNVSTSHIMTLKIITWVSWQRFVSQRRCRN